MWSKGLGLASHIGALNPSLVADVEVEEASEQIRDVFSYMPDAVENPPANPSLCLPCCVLHPGLCRADPNWGKVMKLVQQFEICLENNKMACCEHLLKFSMDLGLDGDQSSSLYSSWHILGCVAKRPLLHVLGRLQQSSLDSSVLLPDYSSESDDTKKHWTLETSSHHLISSLLRKAQERQVDPVNVDIKVHHLAAVGSLEMPNHFRVSGGPCADFTIGTKLVVSRDKVSLASAPASNTQVQLGFGFVFEPAKQQTSARKRAASAKNRGRGGGADKRTRGRDLASGEPRAEDLDTEGAAPELRELLQGNGGDPESVRLDPVAQKELSVVAKLLEVHDDSEPEPDDRTRPGASASAAQPSSNPAPKRKVFSTTRIGVDGFAMAKRSMVCFNCSQGIEKGDMRFEYYFSTQRPPRSIHRECVAQIKVESMQNSIQWIRDRCAQASGEEAKMLEESLEVLEASFKVHAQGKEAKPS